ncbi:hypothetical protein H0I39_02025 [Ottowia beijingensis]|uniref:Uncharacterized protein n=1 Tax=Ottowia beijingensis TaxID=1207057 RepID=A0A853IKH0_9BURK|nr:hypothetical protein [Ottowia beijingensis]NZA00866.1 hypothetical protein [Ottowia beijingensis]
MTLEQRLIALAQAMGADVKALLQAQGSLSALSTTAKNNLVAAINELKTALDNAGTGGVAIDDAAGDGATTVTWSADKIHDTIEAAKTLVKDELTDGAAAALDTLAELAAALNDDPNFAATIAGEIANRVRFDAAQVLTEPQQAQARSNIGAQSAAAIGNPDHDLVADYTDAKA